MIGEHRRPACHPVRPAPDVGTCRSDPVSRTIYGGQTLKIARKRNGCHAVDSAFEHAGGRAGIAESVPRIGCSR